MAVVQTLRTCKTQPSTNAEVCRLIGEFEQSPTANDAYDVGHQAGPPTDALSIFTDPSELGLKGVQPWSDYLVMNMLGQVSCATLVGGGEHRYLHDKHAASQACKHDYRAESIKPCFTALLRHFASTLTSFE